MSDKCTIQTALRKNSELINRIIGNNENAELYLKAADLIDELQSENTRLREQLDKAVEDLTDTGNQLCGAGDECICEYCNIKVKIVTVLGLFMQDWRNQNDG